MLPGSKAQQYQLIGFGHFEDRWTFYSLLGVGCGRGFSELTIDLS